MFKEKKLKILVYMFQPVLLNTNGTCMMYFDSEQIGYFEKL